MKSRRPLLTFLVFAALLTSIGPAFGQSEAGYRLLLFSRTEGYVHASIPDGIAAIQQLGEEHGFDVVETEDAGVFTAESLDRFAVVVFLNTSGDVLNEEQQSAFEQYVRSGGGYVGVHGAAATEYDWPWYGELVGAIFDDHPTPQDAEVIVVNQGHPSTKSLPERWSRFDEWYNFRENPRPHVEVLAVLNERTYEGATMGDDHPIAWYHRFDGGRAWYTGLGHTAESYTDPLFREHLLGGIEWAADVADKGAAANASSRFEKVVLMEDVTDPNELGIASDGRVFVAERAGPIKMWDPKTGEARMVGYIPVRMTIEDGLMGLTLDPDFDANGWLYVYYAPANGGDQRLSRFTYRDGEIDDESEEILLEVHSQQRSCCHSAGSLAFGPDGMLYLSTGDNTDPFPLGGSPIDERPGRWFGDAQRTSANTNDLRGKVLRIRPLADGTYEIPEGNLFETDSLHRGEIYTMGHRNPYRISVDPETGWLYLGDVGIGNAPSEERGPWGWDEFNQVREPGFYGWPYFVGPNEAYRDFDYATQSPGPFFDPEAPVNVSPNNTGARELPPAQPAMIWYTYGPSEEFPELGAGGINPMAGPVYRYDAETASPYALPQEYDGSLIIYEWMRNWIKQAKLDENGDLAGIEPLLPGLTFSRPTDVELGPDGRLYVIEWGETFWGSNPDAQVVRIDYHSGGAVHATNGPSRDVYEDRTSRQVSFLWPMDGAFFELGQPIPYEVRITGVNSLRSVREDGQANEPAAPGQVVVQAFSGHDTHAHAFDPVAGSAGEVVITPQFAHVPDIYYQDQFAEIVAQAAGAGEDTVQLRPHRLQAEHVTSSEGAERRTYGEHPAEPDYPATALTVMELSEGGFAAYAPVNLAHIDSIRIRVRPGAEGMLRLRLDGVSGPELAVVDLHAGRTVAPESVAAQRTSLPGDEALSRVPEEVRRAYDGWRDIVVPISDPGGTHTLYVIAEDADVRLDWMYFVGAGAAGR